MFFLFILIRFNLGKRGIVRKLFLRFVEFGFYFLLLEMFGEFVWKVFKIFIYIFSFKF